MATVEMLLVAAGKYFRMQLDDTAAAFGFFQVVLADLVDHLALATFSLLKRKKIDLDFDEVFNQEAAKILRQFRVELRQFDDRPDIADEVRELREACEIVSRLKTWRNDRIHARIRMTDGGYALYDWRSRRRLPMTRSQMEENIDLAIKAMVAFETHTGSIVDALKWVDEFERAFSGIIEAADDRREG